MINNNMIFLNLNKNIYNKDLIVKTLNIYKDFLDFILFENTTHNIIKFTPKTQEYILQTLTDEFMNYLINEEYQQLKYQS